MMWVRERWGALLVLCCSMGIAAASGCSDSVDTGPEDGGVGSSGQGGSSGSAGSSGSSGAGRGGSAGSAGSSGSASGGTSSTADAGNLTTCTRQSGDDSCLQCARRECCAELLACGQATVCSRGDDAEYPCILNCMRNAVADGGVASSDLLADCAGTCVASGGSIDSVTSNLWGCLMNGVRADDATGPDCVVECFENANAR